MDMWVIYFDVIHKQLYSIYTYIDKGVVKILFFYIEYFVTMLSVYMVKSTKGLQMRASTCFALCRVLLVMY